MIIAQHGINSLVTKPEGLVACVSGTNYYGFSDVTFTSNSTELVSDVLDQPVYANVGTSASHLIRSTDSSIIDLIKNNSFTIEGWFKRRYIGSGGNVGAGSPLFGIFNTSDPTYWCLAVGLTYDGFLSLWINDSNRADMSQVTNDDNYHHIALTRNKTDNKYYVHVDGNQKLYVIDANNISSSNIFYMTLVYDSRVDFNMIQLCIYDYPKYSLGNFTPSRKVINI